MQSAITLRFAGRISGGRFLAVAYGGPQDRIVIGATNQACYGHFAKRKRSHAKITRQPLRAANLQITLSSNPHPVGNCCAQAY